MLRNRKGVNMSVNTLAVIALGLLVVALVYASTTGWFENIGQGFVGSITFPSD